MTWRNSESLSDLHVEPVIFVMLFESSFIINREGDFSGQLPVQAKFSNMLKYAKLIFRKSIVFVTIAKTGL